MTGRPQVPVDFGPAERQGPKEPSTVTPTRPGGSVRRTTTLDASYPEGFGGPLHYQLRARDLRTAADGTAGTSGSVEVRLVAELGGRVLTMDATPHDARLDQLVGANLMARWGARLDDLLPDERDQRSLLYHLLDALPGWSRLAGFGIIGEPGAEARTVDPSHLGRSVGNCAGWRDGGTLHLLGLSGKLGAGFLRPLAPSLEMPDDPAAWHEAEPMAAHSMRRRRRVDLVDGDPLRVDAMFRDTHADEDAIETVLHEYTLDAELDPRSWQVQRIEATPHVLPYLECPWAAGSVAALVGRDVRDMRSSVRKELRGTSTCTHLNELLRTFGDLGELAVHLPRPSHNNEPAVETD